MLGSTLNSRSSSRFHTLCCPNLGSTPSLAPVHIYVSPPDHVFVGGWTPVSGSSSRCHICVVPLQGQFHISGFSPIYFSPLDHVGGQLQISSSIFAVAIFVLYLSCRALTSYGSQSLCISSKLESFFPSQLCFWIHCSHLKNWVHNIGVINLGSIPSLSYQSTSISILQIMWRVNSRSPGCSSR